MILLESANLPASTFINIVSLLVAGSGETTNGKHRSYETHEDRLDNLLDKVEKLKTHWEAYQTVLEPLQQSTNRANTNSTVINTTMSPHIEELDNIEKRAQKTNGTDSTYFVINLDAAVNALKDIKTDSEKSGKTLHINKLETVTSVRDTNQPKYRGIIQRSGHL